MAALQSGNVLHPSSPYGIQYVGYYPQQQAFYQPHVPGMAHFLLHASPSSFHTTGAFFLGD